MLLSGHKVFGVGLSRTGTTSLGRALNRIGIKTIHYPHDRMTHDQLTQGDYKLSILDAYQAIVDITVAPFYAQLDEAYPGSKFILTVRDKPSWLKSLKRHWRDAARRSERDPQFKRFTQFICDRLYGTISYDEKKMANVYDGHVADVQAYFRDRSADLWVLDICGGDGWQPLCEFLGMAVPDRPFPHGNHRGSVGRWLGKLEQFKRDLDHLIPMTELMILIEPEKLDEACLVTGRRVMPFMERAGYDWGRPRDDEMAIGELERLRPFGARYIVFPWHAFWWLDHYQGFAKFLRSHFLEVVANDRLIVFDLGTRPAQAGSAKLIGHPLVHKR